MQAIVAVRQRRAALKGVLHDHLGFAERVLAEREFPDSAQVKPMQGVVG